MNDNYSVYKDKNGSWKGKRDGNSRASVTGSTQKVVTQLSVIKNEDNRQ